MKRLAALALFLIIPGGIAISAVLLGIGYWRANRKQHTRSCCYPYASGEGRHVAGCARVAGRLYNVVKDVRRVP